MGIVTGKRRQRTLAGRWLSVPIGYRILFYLALGLIVGQFFGKG